MCWMEPNFFLIARRKEIWFVYTLLTNKPPLPHRYLWGCLPQPLWKHQEKIRTHSSCLVLRAGFLSVRNIYLYHESICIVVEGHGRMLMIFWLVDCIVKFSKDWCYVKMASAITRSIRSWLFSNIPLRLGSISSQGVIKSSELFKQTIFHYQEHKMRIINLKFLAADTTLLTLLLLSRD